MGNAFTGESRNPKFEPRVPTETQGYTHVCARRDRSVSRQSIRRSNPNIQLHFTAIRNQSHNYMKLLLVLGFERGYESATVGPTDLQRVAAFGIDQHGGVREQQELPCRTSRTDPGQ